MGLLSRHSLAFAILLVLLWLTPGIAAACSCRKEQDPLKILIGTDVILDGYVERVDPAGREDYFIATIKVARAWKGDLPDVVRLEFTPFGSCMGYGMLKAQTSLQLDAFGDPRRELLRVGFCDFAYSGRRPDVQAAVEDYAARYQALRQAADAGSSREKIKLAEFLLAHGDEPQARDVLLQVMNNEPESLQKWITEEGGHEALVWVRHGRKLARPMPPATPPDSTGKLARAIFTLTGVADPNWKDWSNLELIGGECRFETLPLTGASFAGSVLPGCVFSKNTLSNVDFTNATLNQARFDGATLSNVTLDGAQLQKARFDGAILEAGSMRDADAYSASFAQARLRDMELSGSFFGDFTGATLERVKAKISGHLDLTSAILRDVDFDGSDMGVVARNAHFQKVRFGIGEVSSFRAEDTDLSDVDFKYTRWLLIYINCRTVLPAAGIDPRRLIPVERVCPGVQPRTDFTAVNWDYMDLRGLDFSGGNFFGASLSRAGLSGTNLSNSNLSRVDFGGASLSGANLDGANLDSATNLGSFAEQKKGVNGIKDAPPASLRGANFSGTTVAITDLVGIAGLTASVDLDAPILDKVTIHCWEQPLEHFLRPSYRNDAIAAAQARLEADAVRKIRDKWPTAKFTGACAVAH